MRSTIGVGLVNPVAVNITNSCNDAKRPAALVSRIRLYGIYGARLLSYRQASTGQPVAATPLAVLGFAYPVSFASRCVSTFATCNAALRNVLLIARPGGLRVTRMAYHQPPHQG